MGGGPKQEAEAPLRVKVASRLRRAGRIEKRGKFGSMAVRDGEKAEEGYLVEHG